ncbi:MAG: septum formation initiator family protein [Candidatus Cryptobacteroides sp.]
MANWKELWNGENKTPVRIATVATVLILAFALFFSPSSVVHWIQAGRQLRQEKRQIEILSSEIRSMDKEIEMLSNDRDTLEEFARRNFGFAAPGDDVYIIEQ